MKKNILFFLMFLSGLFAMLPSVYCQSGNDTAVNRKSGQLWGLGFGDMAFKTKSDPLGRGATNQYTGIGENQSMFQFRRLYLGYDNRISKRFSAEFLLAMEENNAMGTASGQPLGDLLSNGRYGLFIKTGSVTWHNIFKNHNLTMGQMFTPATVLTTEPVWEYRCIERTISELRRTPAWDLGMRLNGTLHNSTGTELGYYLMVGNGTGSKPENNRFKWFYGDVYLKFLNRKMVIDLYADYNRMAWTPTLRQDRNMLKLMLAYTTSAFTMGVEAFTNRLRNDVIAMRPDSSTMRFDTRATNYSVFARGRLYGPQLGFFVRYDGFNPSQNNDNSKYIRYTPTSENYNPNTREQFFTAGLDYSPNSNIHILPNVWYTRYRNAGPSALADGTDVVYRLSVYYVYGK
jgi:hypothetical protein